MLPLALEEPALTSLQFLWAKDVRTRLFPKIFRLLSAYAPAPSSPLCSPSHTPTPSLSKASGFSPRSALSSSSSALSFTPPAEDTALRPPRALVAPATRPPASQLHPAVPPAAPGTPEQ